MARREGRGVGCATVLAVIVFALIGCWQFGFIDRLLYVAQIEHALPEPLQAAPVVVDIEESQAYAYSQLDESDQERYRIVYDSFKSREPRTYPETTMDELARIRDCVLSDHPELFYVNGVRQLTTTNRGSGLVTDVTIEGQYSYSEDEAAQLQAQIDAAVADCLAGAPEGDDYALAKYFYEYLAATTEYDHAVASTVGVIGGGAEAQGTSPGQTIADVFCYHTAVCGGYASAYQYLMKQVGIPCTYIVGDANGGGHAWCMALLDGQYYYIDPTWGDPQFLTDGGVSEASGAVNYDYLCVTTADLATTHVVSDLFPVPDCTSTDDNYFVREGLMFDWSDVDRLGALAYDALSQGSALQIRCTSADVYWDLLDNTIVSGALAAYLPENVYRYSSSETLFTIAVYPA